VGRDGFDLSSRSGRTDGDVLLDHGAAVNGKIDGRTALMQAAEAGDLSVTQLLLAKGADINAKDQGEETALTLCADQGNTEIVQALLDAGADVTVKTGWWNCALCSSSWRA